MTNTETIKTALIKQIIDSGSNIPLSVLVGNIDLLINAAKAEQCIAISDKVIGSHITEPIEIDTHGGNDIPQLTDPQL
jgi:hypothetical protein